MTQWLAGFHVVEARLKSGELGQIELDRARRDRRAQDLLRAAERYGVPVKRVSAKHLDESCPEVKHQGVRAALLSEQAELAQDWRDCVAGVDKPLILVLDGVEDPRNLGACLRSADGAGAQAVIVPKRRSAGLTATARATAAGAAEHLPLIVVPNLGRCLQDMQQAGFWVVGLADQDDGSLYDAELDRPLVLVLGNEGQGIRQLTRRYCDTVVSLPMRGQVSSLNVSVATGIALYEVQRQRGI